MSRLYLDTSAAAKLLVQEAESEALARHLSGHLETGGALVSSILLETELRRFAVRIDLPQAAVTALLDGVDLFDMPTSIFTEAGLLPGRHLRSLDALHLAVAVRCGVEALLTYDARMADAARSLGLVVLTAT